MIKARITSIEIEGFRSLQAPRRFDLRRPDDDPIDTLVIAGPNGIGKTALLEGMLYALDRTIYPARCWDTARVRLTMRVSSAPGTSIGPYAPCEITIERSQSEWVAHLEPDFAVVRELGIKLLLRDLAVKFFSSRRRVSLPGSVRPFTTPGDESPEAGRLRWIKQRIVDERARSAFRDGDRSIGWLERMSRAWAALKGCSEHLGLGQPLVDKDYLDLYVRRMDEILGAIPICSVDEVSSGELEWLVLIGELVTTDFTDILVIDEPELHMHVEWQARLLPTLRAVAPESQIIMASNSDAIWDQVYSFERLLLVPPGDPREG